MNVSAENSKGKYAAICLWKSELNLLHLPFFLKRKILHLSRSPSWLASEFFWMNAELRQCTHPARIYPYQLGSIEANRVPLANRFFLCSNSGGYLELI
ncbi:hypothetical protein F511_14349 [Dorcoceras hygrometricum]|uniref:Uncharacterized protein n=1 Tax=Dorcoceras hygrometricum TaxID=472368 RepID=A0A2Z7A4H0_9LAMI|nr:hypothetical protein F511_14349 [Dorcoceras hygrometricum]